MNMLQWKASVLNGINRTVIPIMTHTGIDIIGKKVIDAVTNGLHFGNKIDLVKTLQQVPNNIWVLENFYPVRIFKMAPPQEVEYATLNLLKLTAQYKNFSISTGCDIPPRVPKRKY